MDPHADLKARNSFGAEEKDVPVPVMPAVPIMATPVLPVEKIRAISFHQGTTEQDELNDIENLGQRYDKDLVPIFEKRASATILEVFYDFWVVANLSVFMNVHQVADSAALWSYIGYISLVWFNWFLVGCFDVRYVTDSIFERIARTLHLGVVVGFAVVAPNYDPNKQNKGTWQCMSLILMVSRLVLVFEYITILWHIRKFKQGKLPLLAATVFHFVAAMVYLGVSFRFEDNRNSNAYIAWYLLMGLEAIVQVGLSLFSKVLSFNGTHLCDRMTILTMFILGEGVTVIIDSVVNIVKNNGWTSSTIGVLVAAVGTVYFVFMLYTDWMQGYASLANWRQISWSLLHFPFHVFLLLFIKGSAQFMIWWKVTQVETDIMRKFEQALHLDVEYITSEAVVASLNATIESVWVDYKPIWGPVFDEINYRFDQIRLINDTEWNVPDNENTEEFWATWQEALDYLGITVVNSVFGNFKFDAIQDLIDSGDAKDLTTDQLNAKAYQATTERFYLVFQYVFACAGMALITMTILYLIIKRQPTTGRTKVFFYLRTAVFFLFGIGLSLVTLLSLDWTKGSKYLYTPWLLPTLCGVFFILLLLTHAPRPPPAVVFSRLPNPMHAWTNSRKDNAPTGMGTGTTTQDSAFVRMKSFMGSKKSGGSSGSYGPSGGQYSQVHVTEMTTSPGSRYSSGSYHGQASAGMTSTAYDPYTWDPQQQQQQQQQQGTEYFGTSAYAQAQPQQAYPQYEQYVPQQSPSPLQSPPPQQQQTQQLPQYYQPPPASQQQQQYPQYPHQGY